MVAKTAQQYLNQLGLQLSFGKSRQKEGGFSNFDEERILARFIAELLPADHSRTAVDIGAGDGIKASNSLCSVPRRLARPRRRGPPSPCAQAGASV